MGVGPDEGIGVLSDEETGVLTDGKNGFIGIRYSLMSRQRKY